MLYSEIVTNLLEKKSIVPNKFSYSTAKDYYADIYFLVEENNFHLFDVSEDVVKTFVLLK